MLKNDDSLRNHVMIAQASPADPYTNTVHRDSSKHHLCNVHRSIRSIPRPSPSSSIVAAKADFGPARLLGRVRVLTERGRGNLCVNLSLVLSDGRRTGRLLPVGFLCLSDSHHEEVDTAVLSSEAAEKSDSVRRLGGRAAVSPCLAVACPPQKENSWGRKERAMSPPRVVKSGVGNLGIREAVVRVVSTEHAEGPRGGWAGRGVSGTGLKGTDESLSPPSCVKSVPRRSRSI